MKEHIKNRTLELARHICKTNDTVRGTATVFGISKSTVHKDVTTRLEQVDYELFHQVANVLATNLSERHLRGGKATKAKYEHMHN